MTNDVARVNIAVMPPTVAGDGTAKWHATVALDEFVQQVACLVEIVDMTKTTKLGLFDADTIKRAMGWGSYIEEVSRCGPRESCHNNVR